MAPVLERGRTWATIGVSLGVMVWLTTYYQLTIHNLEEYVNANLAQHAQTMQGVAGNPWQYRVLSDYLLEGLFWLIAAAGAKVVYLRGFVILRVVQEALIYSLGFAYLKKLGLSTGLALVGLSALMLGMVLGQETTGARVDTYSDVIFYLAGALLVLSRRYALLLPVIALAAANRETSGFIALLPLGMVRLHEWREPATRRVLWFVAAGLAIYLTVIVGLHLAFGFQPPSDTRVGLEMLSHNVNNDDTFVRLAATLGILPIVTFGLYPRLCPFLRTLVWLVIPAWFVVHAVGSVMTESALFFVPLALVFIPAALQAASAEQAAGAPQLQFSAPSPLDFVQLPDAEVLQHLGQGEPAASPTGDRAQPSTAVV